MRTLIPYYHVGWERAKLIFTSGLNHFEENMWKLFVKFCHELGNDHEIKVKRFDCKRSKCENDIWTMYSISQYMYRSVF